MQAASHQRPELHVTPEAGVLEAPAGAVIADGAMHVFHQFRPRDDKGSRWAHQVASEVAYDWDICDDILAPTADDIDILAGSSLTLEDGSVELFFVTTRAGSGDSTDLQSNQIDHRLRGNRDFRIERAHIADIGELVDVNDDPTQPDPHVERLGPITIDDSAYPVDALVTPSVIHDGDGGLLMIALSLEGTEDARIVVLRSTDRQNWRVEGPLELPDSVPSDRPFAPRIFTMTDKSTEKKRTVLLLTYRDREGRFAPSDTEITGYLVGDLNGTRFDTTTEFTPVDYGHNFTRPRVMPYSTPVMFGLVGTTPKAEELWANCLSAPRYLSLVNDVLHQDLIGAPRAVQAISDRALLWTGQLDAESGSVTVDITNTDDEVIASVVYTGEAVSVHRDEVRTAPLPGADSDTLTIFVDGPVCEVFVDGGMVTLTSTIPANKPLAGVNVRPAGGAQILTSMITVGQELQRSLAGLDSPEAQEELIQQAMIADREIS